MNKAQGSLTEEGLTSFLELEESSEREEDIDQQSVLYINNQEKPVIFGNATQKHNPKGRLLPTFSSLQGTEGAMNCTGQVWTWNPDSNAQWVTVEVKSAATSSYSIGIYQNLTASTSSPFFFPISLLYTASYGYKPGTPALTFRMQQGSPAGTSSVKTSSGSLTFQDVPWGNLTIAVTQTVSTSVKVAWTSFSSAPDNGNTGGLLYQVESKCSTCPDFTPIVNTSSSSRTFTIPTTLDYTTTYTFRVLPYNSCGVGKYYSNSVTITTWCGAPTNVFNLVVTMVAGNMQFDWTALTTNADTGGCPMTNYQLEWADTIIYWYTFMVNTTANTYTDTTWACNYPTAFRLKAYNTQSAGAYSTAVLYTTPNVPTAMTAPTVSEMTCTYVTLTWTPLANRPDISYYTLYYKLSSGSTYSALLTSSSMYNGTTYTHYYTNASFPLAYNTAYKFIISAGSTGCGPGTNSSSVTITTPTVPTTMTAPVIATTDITPTSIKITWTALTTVESGNCAVTFYQLQFALSSSSTWTDVTTTPYTLTEISQTSGYLANTAYKYRIRAQNTIGAATTWSPETTITTDAVPQAPSAPTSVTITPTSINMTWTELTGDTPTGRDTITYYKLEWYNSGSNSWVTVNTDESTLTTWAEYTLGSGVFPSNSDQIFRVTAKNGVGYGASSANATVAADSVPTSMTPPELVEAHPYNITVKWTELGEPDNGRDVPTFYLLSWYDSDNSVWVDLTSEAVDGKVTQYTHVRVTLFNHLIQQQYRLLAKNGVGWGSANSTVLLVTTPSQPLGMTSVTCDAADINPTNITIKWPELTDTTQNGGDLPSYYKVEWYDGSSWVVISNEADGKLLQLTHNHIIVFASGSTQQYRVTPKNQVGFGTVYSSVSCTADTEPITMNTPTASSINPKSITVQWTALTTVSDTGGDAITFYNIEWDQGTGVWLSLNVFANGKVTTYAHTSTTVFTPNINFNYRVRAMNGVGYGPFSGNLTVLTDDFPYNMPAPTNTSVKPNEIQLSWTYITADTDTGRDAITYYEVRYRPDAVSAWVPLTTSAVGKQNTYTHTVNPYFTPDVDVYYKICPMNGVGMNICSSEIAVLTDKAPTFMNPPTAATADITPLWIKLSWTALTVGEDTGRADITYYGVEWDQGISTWTNITTEAIGVVTSFNHTTVTAYPANTVFKYRAYAKNGVGYGPYSTELTITTDNIPQFMNPPSSTQVDYNSIDLTWTAITADADTGRDSVTYYKVEFFNRPCYTALNGDCGTELESLGVWTEVSVEGTQGASTTFTHAQTDHFYPDVDHKYRVCAKNLVGMGACSTEVTVRTDAVPLQMSAPANVTVTYNMIEITWGVVTDDAASGRSPVTKYQIQWDNYLYSDPSFTEASWVNVGQVNQNTGVANLNFQHTVNPHFDGNKDVRYRISAINNVGMGPFSTTLLLKTDDIPQQMTPPSIADGDITYNSIKVTWTAQDTSQIGGDTILYYKLEWDQGDSNLGATDNTWTELTSISGGVLLEHTQTSGTHFANNTVFRYRLTSMNGVGYGPCSTPTSITSDRTPLQMDLPTNGTVLAKSIIVNWVDLVGNENIGRDPLIHYIVEYNSGSSWSTVATLAQTVLTYTHTLAVPFPANTDRTDYTVKYRVSAENGVGIGIPSPELSVVTSTYPKKMDPVVVNDADITPVGITISWTRLDQTIPADIGRDPIINYQLEWLDYTNPSNTNWVVLTTAPEADSSYIVTSGFTINTVYHIRVAAINGVGIGAYSDIVSITTDNVPTRMNTPVEDPTTNANLVKVTWTSITDSVDTGRDDVIYYKLEWNQGTINVWQELTSPGVLVNEFTQTTALNGIQNGTSYQYKITPQNRAGYGTPSAIITIIPSSIPDQMAAVTTTLLTSDVFVTIAWTLPQQNGAAVTSYTIEIQTSVASVYSTDTVNCDGSNPTVVANRQCNVPMSVLRAAPFNLAKGAYVIARAKAANIKGENTTYSPNNVGTIAVETEPDAPSGLARVSASTDETKMTVQFTAIANLQATAGGVTASILSYHIQRNQGNSTGVDTWTDIKGFATPDLTTTYTATAAIGIVGGTTYKVRVRASNKYGWGVWNTPVNVRCAAKPGTPPTITITNNTIYMNIAWGYPNDHGLAITSYTIHIKKNVGGSWALIGECDGTNAAIVTNRNCDILMSTLRTTTSWNYQYNSQLSVRIYATNPEGTSTTYQQSLNAGSFMQDVPLAPTTLITNDPASTNDLQIKIFWTALPDIASMRGYQVSSYEVYWLDYDKVQMSDYELLYTDTQPFQYQLTYNYQGGDSNILTKPLVGGTRYKFKYKGVNIHGGGALIATESIFYASTVPDQLAAPSTSLSFQTVTIQWTVTPNDHKQTVTQYRVKFKNKAGSWVEDTAICKGSSATVVSTQQCTANMLLFTTNLALAIDDLIEAKVEAMNVMGYSTPSNPNTVGVTAKKLPQIAPSSLARGAATGKTSVQIDWTGLSANQDTGGQPVDYKIQYDKASNGVNWYTLIDTTTNQTTYTDTTSFTTGKAYQFKVAAFNDFGTGPYSTAFTIWTAIAPSGLADPTTTLNLLTYIDDDDIVVIDWVPPTDDGGLAVSYKIEVKKPDTTWTEVDQPNECSEKGTITNYFLPQATTANAATQCTMLVSKLKSKYALAAGDTVLARITAQTVVGSTTSSLAGTGTAIIPIPSCFRTTFPRVLGGTNAMSSIMAMDVDTLGNIVVGGSSQDNGILGKTSPSALPVVVYIAKGNYYAWGKYIETTDGVTSNLFTQVLDIAFRYDGQKIALALDRTGYGQAYTIVILNKDGTLFGSFKESTNAKGKVNITSLLFDNSNYVTVALDISQDGSDQKKNATVMRFLANPAATTITPSFYYTGGGANKISQAFCLQRIKSDPNYIYASVLVTDTSQNRKALLAKMSTTNGAITKYFQYTTTPLYADYNTDTSFAVIKRMSLYEDDISTLQIISACLVSYDGFKPHFGQFIFSTTQVYAVQIPQNANRWYCLGTYQRVQNIAYVLYNDRSANLPSGYNLFFGKIDYTNKKVQSIPVVNHDGDNNYYGALFVHSNKFYYWGDGLKQITSSTYTFGQRIGFLNLFDQLDSNLCTSGSQMYSFSSGSVITVNMDVAVTANMNWITSGLASGPSFASASGRLIKPFTLTVGVSNINLKEPLLNNTWCPVSTNPGTVVMTPPTITTQTRLYDPDATSYPLQDVTFLPFNLDRTCPDAVMYYNTFLSDTSQPLPSFITFDPTNSKYWFAINSAAQVGTYQIMLQSTVGNNVTTFVNFQVQVFSPCLNLGINVPALSSTPTFDISDQVPLYVDLDWEVITPPTQQCWAPHFVFTLLNATAGGVVDTSIFSIVNISSVQQIKVWTQSIPAAKLWTDIKIEGRLQGDLVKTYVYSIQITNKCAVTSIIPVPIADQIYYTGRDPIDYQFIWSETVGTCGPISYFAKEYLPSDLSSNNSLDTGVFAYPKPSGGNDTLEIYTWDDAKVGSYQVRVYGSLGVGGFKQVYTTFTVQVIKDPCSYYPYVTPFVEDLTLWVNQSNQVVNIPPFTMNDTNWVCNFTYEIRSTLNAVLDSAFVVQEVANEGQGTSITLSTSDPTKVELSPQGVKVKGWPKRQNTTSQQFTFRIFVAYFVKTDCPSGQYFNVTNDVCQNCISPCSTCQSDTQCTWCIAGYTYIQTNMSCVQTISLPDCPPGTIRDPQLSICRQCIEFCQTCTDINTCDTCIAKYSLANGKCYANRICPEGYRYNDLLQGCVECPAGCASCPNVTTCTYCKDGFYLDTATGVCSATCTKGYFADLNSRVCMVCSPTCSACVTNNYTCTECQDVGGVAYYLFQNTCVTRCPYIGYYQNDTVPRTCMPCKAECKICVNAIDDCIVCNPGSVISGRQCLNSCPDGYYITVIGTCFQCDPTCSKCYGSQNSMCTQCTAGSFLTQTTCDSKCNPPLFPDPASRTCKTCQYYCNQCTTINNCMKCKTGFIQIPNDCSGEYFLKVSSSQSIQVPLNPTLVNDAFNPSSAAVELWFKADNIQSMNLEIILGLSPYKFRKKAGVAQVQINWLDLNYCDSTNLKSGQWYHFAFSMTEEDSGSLYCYLDGELLNVGQAPVAAITADIMKFKEINFGSSVDIKTSESKFNGYIREFRWWKKTRSQFQIRNFRTVGLTDLENFSPPNQLIAYWKLDEKKTETKLYDYASGNVVLFDPSTIGKAVGDIMEMREIYLKMCTEGTFAFFNETLNLQTCLACDPSCKNCNGNSSVNCTSCQPPYKLLETEQKCIINADCPQGFWKDTYSNCWPCHSYCTDCYGPDQFKCNACKAGFFKAYKRAGCVDSCPRGLYGNYLTQSCSANPLITSLHPEDGLIIAYGTFVDLIAQYQVLNDEPRSTYSYGWIITKLNSQLDIARDAAKKYAGQDIVRVHLDNNIIEPNNYYNITFFVKGNDTFYNGMLGVMFNVIYIGIPPKGGVCFASPPQGIASITEFTFSTGNWIDPDGIAEYHFSYSLDNGVTYLPIQQNSYVESQIKYTFQPIFKSVNVILNCKVKSIKGFYADQETSILLAKRSTSNSKVELSKFSLNNITSEQQSLTVANQLVQIATDIGQLKTQTRDYFDPKISIEACSEEICNFGGECQYNTFTKKYFCKCYGIKAGVNCTFKNKTELEQLKNLTLENARIYIEKSQNTYDSQYLKTVTSQIDIMTNDLFDKVHDLIFQQVLHLSASDQEDSDFSKHQDSLEVLSQMLEYLAQSQKVANLTWNMTDRPQEKKEQLDWMWDSLNRTIKIVNMIRNATLYKLSFLQTQIQMTTRMVSIKQVLSRKDRILSMPATDNIKKQFQSYIKISPANFMNSSVPLNDEFIAEAIEYAFNPYQMGNNDRIAGNIFEINLYNQNVTVTNNDISKVLVENLPVPIELAFPSNDNQNLTQFLTDYNLLSSYRFKDRKKKEEMLVKSGLSCVYWDEEMGAWSKKGCSIASLDTTHVKCACNHMSAFSITFSTPVLTNDAPLLENTTIKADPYQDRPLTLSDIIKWPLNDYFNNMYELWQHKRPSFLSFIIKPGFIVLILFWAMYLSSLIYYTGRDDLKRDQMTKSQNREDLAEINDDVAQNLGKVIRDLIVRDFLYEHGKYIIKASRQMRSSLPFKKQIQPPQIKIFELMSRDEKKKYKKRARKKVFGAPGTLCERAARFYRKTMKNNKSNPNAKMSFFNEELKNNLWIGLIAKTSKIAPRHVRLLLMYFYTALYMIFLTIIFGFQIQELISESALFQVVALSILLQIGVWVITIPVALVFRMPMHLREQIAGVRAKKVNKAFKEIDKQMGNRYAIGYFICLTTYFMMTVMVIVFNLFYPHDYVMGWAFNILLLYIFDLIIFTFLLAAVQMGNVIISQKVKCWYNVWAAIEIFRYVKNLRG